MGSVSLVLGRSNRRLFPMIADEITDYMRSELIQRTCRRKSLQHPAVSGGSPQLHPTSVSRSGFRKRRAKHAIRLCSETVRCLLVFSGVSVQLEPGKCWTRFLRWNHAVAQNTEDNQVALRQPAPPSEDCLYLPKSRLSGSRVNFSARTELLLGLLRRQPVIDDALTRYPEISQR